MNRAGILGGAGVLAVAVIVVALRSSAPGPTAVRPAAAVHDAGSTQPPQPQSQSQPPQFDVPPSWDEFRARDTQPMGDQSPHPSAWCFTSRDPREPDEEEVYSCHPTPARCAEVREGEVEGAREQNEPRRVSRCREARTIWCAMTLTPGLWMCRSTRRLCDRHLEAMRRDVRGYDAIDDCEERWIR